MFAILATLLVLPVAFSPFGAQVAAAQGCIVRTDWPVYTVVRGDTLNKIGQRYGTTAGVLASANCLANINTIYAGQQLRVPPSPIVLTPVPQQPPPTSSFNVRIQYQRFDNGFMFWRADNGEISVYIGQSSGTTIAYASYSYGLLPDNPVNEATPANHFRPAFGIGKVWGNFYNVRSNLGWATTPETSFVTSVNRTGNGYFNFVIPDGRVVYVNPNRTWSTTGSPVPYPTAVPPTPVGPTTTTTAASYQPFDGGFMIWESRTGNVVVFYNNGSALNATYTVYPASQYGRLPDVPLTLVPPDGHVRPINGFGKVWINFAEPYNNLGWPQTPEQGFTATFITHTTSTQSETCFVRPDGNSIHYVRLNNGVRYWMFSQVCE
jgi:LysM repeat protein